MFRLVTLAIVTFISAHTYADTTKTAQQITQDCMIKLSSNMTNLVLTAYPGYDVLSVEPLRVIEKGFRLRANISFGESVQKVVDVDVFVRDPQKGKDCRFEVVTPFKDPGTGL